MPADLLQHNCLTLPGPAWSQWPFHTHEGINRLAVSGTFTSDNADLLLDMAVAGLGIARLADFMVARAVQQGTLVPLLLDSHMPEAFPIHALTVPGRHRAPRIKAFIDFRGRAVRPCRHDGVPQPFRPIFRRQAAFHAARKCARSGRARLLDPNRNRRPNP